MKKGLFVSFSCIFFMLSYSQQGPNKILTAKQKDSLIRLEMEKMEDSENKWKGKAFGPIALLSQKVRISAAELNGKVIFVNFWFASCAPCIAEFRALNELYMRLKGNKNFEFISFTFEDAATIKKIRSEYGLLYNIITISDEDCRILNLSNGYPTNILLNKNNIINNLYLGGLGTESESKIFMIQKILPEINRLLKNDPRTD
jgi:thiol-disulfide isomerase/thioredoxin